MLGGRLLLGSVVYTRHKENRKASEWKIKLRWRPFSRHHKDCRKQAWITATGRASYEQNTQKTSKLAGALRANLTWKSHLERHNYWHFAGLTSLQSTLPLNKKETKKNWGQNWLDKFKLHTSWSSVMTLLSLPPHGATACTYLRGLRKLGAARVGRRPPARLHAGLPRNRPVLHQLSPGFALFWKYMSTNIKYRSL